MSKAAETTKVTARSYTSPTLVLLAMDWTAGAKRSDFLGFAILRSPGFAKGEKDAWLTNKIGFSPPTKTSQPMPSNIAPFQKFLWWDSSITDTDRGRTFTYTITPVCGTGPNDLQLQHGDETSIDVPIPNFERDGIWTCFNRAVVSSQAFTREFPNPGKNLDGVMAWLANGIEKAFPEILNGAKDVTGAIYHLTDNEWVVPAMKAFAGKLDIVYENQGRDNVDDAAISILKGPNFHAFPRSKTHIMHDKFMVDRMQGRVLAGSANFTPEGLTSQANLLHIFTSKELAEIFAARAALIQSDPTIAATAKDAGWSKPVKIGDASLRVFFSPEPKGKRVSMDTVVAAVKAAKASVCFCMFDPTDPQLLNALLATSDKGRLLYGLLNSIADPNKTKKSKEEQDDDDHRAASGMAPEKPSAGTQVQVQLFNRSREEKAVISYNYFRPKTTPAGFLPEFSSVDLTSKSTLSQAKPDGKKRPPPAVHIHHKFIVIDAEMATPTIFTGSANLSRNSTNFNDENLIEITGSPALAQTYFAEFMRLYEHYRARAIWDMGGTATAAKGSETGTKQAFTLKTSRDAWVKKAYQAGSLDALARVALAVPLTNEGTHHAAQHANRNQRTAAE